MVLTQTQRQSRRSQPHTGDSHQHGRRRSGPVPRTSISACRSSHSARACRSAASADYECSSTAIVLAQWLRLSDQRDCTQPSTPAACKMASSAIQRARVRKGPRWQACGLPRQPGPAAHLQLRPRHRRRAGDPGHRRSSSGRSVAPAGPGDRVHPPGPRADLRGGRTPVAARTVPKLLMRALGLVNPMMRDLAEMAYEFGSPSCSTPPSTRPRLAGRGPHSRPPSQPPSAGIAVPPPPRPSKDRRQGWHLEATLPPARFRCPRPPCELDRWPVPSRPQRRYQQQDSVHRQGTAVPRVGSTSRFCLTA